MKKILILLLALASIISISLVANAWGPGPGYPPPPPPPYWGPPPGDDRMEALSVLDKTRDYLFRAQRVAYGRLCDDLRYAFDLQKDARELYRQWQHQRAIRVSLHAREIAQDIIEAAERRAPPPPPPHHHHDRRSSIHFHLDI